MHPLDVTQDARAVAALAEYLQELQREAGQLAERFDVQQRGYFSVSEEEAARRLQVSYWQTRAALFDVIATQRHHDEGREDHDPQRFLIAFGAALLLVDAARFLREHFHHLPAVRAKLDEPEREFQIPPRMYETVQKSLTSPRHVWHLYHAMQYFEQHRATLAALAEDPQFGPIWQVVLRLEHRLDVSATAFARARLRVRARHLSAAVSQRMLGRALYGIQKLVSSLMADKYVRWGHHPQLPAAISKQVVDQLLPGDVLIVRKEHAITNYFLPGYWPHAALYLGTAEELQPLGVERQSATQLAPFPATAAPQEMQRQVLEAMKDGVLVRTLASPFASDSIVVLRPHLNGRQIGQGLARALRHEGKSYDFDFDFSRSDRLVCTEVVYRAYDGLGTIQFQLSRRAGRDTLAAGDIIRLAIAGQGFEPVCVYAPKHADAVQKGPAATCILAAEESGEDRNPAG